MRLQLLEQVGIGGSGVAREYLDNISEMMSQPGADVSQLKRFFKDHIAKESKEKKKVPAHPQNTAKVVKKVIKQPHILLPQDWMVDAFGDIVKQSEPKRHLFKLLEFNKIEVIRSQRIQ